MNGDCCQAKSVFQLYRNDTAYKKTIDDISYSIYLHVVSTFGDHSYNCNVLGIVGYIVPIGLLITSKNRY